MIPPWNSESFQLRLFGALPQMRILKSSLCHSSGIWVNKLPSEQWVNNVMFIDFRWFWMILAALSKRPGADSHDLPQAAWCQSSISWARHVVPRQDTLPGRTIGCLGSLGLGNTPKQWQQQFITIHHHLSLSSFITSSRCFSLVCAVCDFLICGFGVSTAVVLGTYWAEIGVQTD